MYAYGDICCFRIDSNVYLYFNISCIFENEILIIPSLIKSCWNRKFKNTFLESANKFQDLYKNFFLAIGDSENPASCLSKDQLNAFIKKVFSPKAEAWCDVTKVITRDHTADAGEVWQSFLSIVCSHQSFLIELILLRRLQNKNLECEDHQWGVVFNIWCR